jgi:hypothetical protein
LAVVRGIADLDAACGVGFKFGEGFVDNNCHSAQSGVTVQTAG